MGEDGADTTQRGAVHSAIYPKSAQHRAKTRPPTTLHYTKLRYTTPHYTTLHCTTFHYTSLHCYITLHYTPLQLHNYTHYTPLYSTTRRRQTVPHALQTNSAKYGPNVVENWICIRSMPSGQSYINSLRCSSTFRHQKLGLHTLHAPPWAWDQASIT